MSIFWDKHQKLWNDDLLSLLNKSFGQNRFSAYARLLIIYLDSVLMYIRVLGRKLSYQNRKSGNKVYWFDLGLHKKGEEARYIISDLFDQEEIEFEAYGFEASVRLSHTARENLGDLPNFKVINAALTDVIPEGGIMRLYEVSNDLGNSLYAKGDEGYEEVEALKLSDFIQNHNIDLLSDKAFLRMNIEGGEVGVIRNLAHAGLLEHFDGFYGMWDDLQKKATREEQDEIAGLLRKHKVKNLTFNGRDMKFSFRRSMIKKDIRNRIGK